MGHLLRAAAVAAAFVGLQTADAGFAYTTASRSVSAATPSQSDVKSTSALGSWFGSAFAASVGTTALANQGSDLAAATMSLVGAGQAIGASGAGSSASSIADVTFIAMSEDGGATVDVNWIIGLSQNIGGAGSASVQITLTDVTTSTIRLMLSNNTTASGVVNLISGNTYRLVANATSSASSAGNGFASFNGSFSIVPAPGALALLGLGGVIGSRGRLRSRKSR